MSGMTTFRQPARSGYLPPEVVPMLDVAALVASRDETRPVLRHVLWEGLKASTRVVATDTYRMFVARSLRRRSHVKPGAGDAWGIHAQVWCDVMRRQAQRDNREVHLGRHGDVIELSCGGETRRWRWAESSDRDTWPDWPNWRKCVPDAAKVAWEIRVRLSELAQHIAAMRRAYHKREQSCRAWWYRHEEMLIIMPDLHLRERHWDSRWVGAAIKGAVLRQRADVIMVLDLELLHDVLERLAYYCPDADAIIRVWGELQPMQIVIPAEADRLESWLLVMPQDPRHRYGQPWVSAGLPIVKASEED